MGCDGGTIPKRDELVRQKKKPEQKDKEAERSFRWKHCAISQQPLEKPIVACGLGRLYNKESVLEGLLDRTKLPETASHITSLKDVKELVLTPNPAYKPEKGGEKGESGCYVDYRNSPYCCPVIGLEISGQFNFVFPWTCGCVVSEKALKEIPSTTCHNCQKSVSEDDFVILNADGEVLEIMRTRLENRKLIAKANKKNKKQNNGIVKEEKSSSSTDNGDDVQPLTISSKISTSTLSIDKSSASTVIVQSPVISDVNLQAEPNEVCLSDEIKLNIPIRIKKEKDEEKYEKRNDKKRSRSPEKKHRRKEHHGSSKDHHKSSHHRRDRGYHKSSKDHISKHRRRDDKLKKIDSIADPAYKKAKTDYSVAKDPKASSVYKSIFTSHDDAKNQTKAHWVTYNPFYN